MQKNIIGKLWLAVFMVPILTGCTFQVRLVTTPTPDIFSTGVANLGSAAPLAATMSPGFTPSAAPQPTQPSTQAGQVAMDPGATDASMEGYVNQDGRVTYQVSAKAGQFMIVTFNSAHSNLYLEIQAPDGRMLAQAASHLTVWEGFLPAGGDYRVSVVAKGGPENFNLNIMIPVQVKFELGAVSAALKGQIGSRRVNTYLFRALKDQTMTVTVDTPNKDVFLSIYGLQDGQPLLRSAAESTQTVVKLPSTQDYVIDLVSGGDHRESYSVTFFVK